MTDTLDFNLKDIPLDAEVQQEPEKKVNKSASVVEKGPENRENNTL